MVSTYDILLVDDEKEFIDILAKRLKKRGYSVRVAYSVERALHLVHDTLFRAAILDVNLPDGNGHDLFEIILTIQPEIQAVMLTGYGDLQKAFRMGKKGLCAYFGKPCDIDEILDALSEALKG